MLKSKIFQGKGDNLLENIWKSQTKCLTLQPNTLQNVN